MPRRIPFLLTAIIALAIAGCGGGGGSAPASYTISGSVTGLSGQGLALTDNGAGNLTVSSNGGFTLPTALADGSTYSVAVATQPAGQTCTVGGGGNSQGGGTVSGSDVTNITVTCINNNVTVGGSVKWLAPSQTVVLQNNSGDNLTVPSDGTFTFSNKIANGKAYAVTVMTQPSGQTCRVTGGDNGTGGGTAANGANITNVVVNCSRPRYAYVVSHDDATVSSYVVDATTGRLKWIGRTQTETNPQSVTVDPSGRYAYVANNGSNTVSQYKIGTDGALSPILSNATVGTDQYPVSVAVHPSGKYAYVANQFGTVSQYTVNNDGSLTALSPTSVAAGQLPTSVAVDPSGKYAYVTNSGDNTVSQYTIGADGSLTPMSSATVVTGSGPYAITVASSGKYAFVVNHNSGNTGSVSEYAIGSDGSLTALASSAEPTGTGPVSITVDPTAHYAYVPNKDGNNISQYAIGSGGLLTALAAPTVAAGAGPTAVVIDPTGKYAYAVNTSGNTVSQYKIGSDGSLSVLTPSTAAAYAAPDGIVISQGIAAVQPVAKYAYVVNSKDNSVSQFTINGDGTLKDNGSTSTGTASQDAVTVSPSGRYAYVVGSANGSSVGTVLEFDVAGDGTLSPIANHTSITAGANPECVAVDPAGRYAYVTNNNDGTVSQYTIGADGSLAAIAGKETVAAGASNPVCIAVDPSGRYAYVTGSAGTANTGTVSQFAVGADGGLSALSTATVNTSGNPYGVAVDPSGSYVYVTSDDGTTNQFGIGSGGGLTPLSAATAAAGTNPVAVAVTPSDTFAYVVNTGATGASTGSISPYTVSNTGILTPITDPSTSQTTISMPAGTTLPLSLALDPTGQYVYVVSNNGGSTAGTVAQFSIGSGGVLSPLSTPINAGTGAWYIATAGGWQ